MTERIQIGDKYVGRGEPVFVIAEVGSNHNRDLEQAKRLTEVAADAGVDAVKFQLFRAGALYAEADPMFAVMSANELPREWVNELAAQARARGLIFLASPFDPESVEVLHDAGVPAYKWASSETVNLPLLRQAAAHQIPMIIATGMCDLADVGTAVDVVRAVGNEDIMLLQCASLYPAAPAQVNLRVMDTLWQAFRVPVGFSDHTLGFSVTLAAVARGARIIEKHFTLSRDMKGPDHGYALEPGELKQMVTAIRDVEASLGSSLKDMLPEEKAQARRESITAAVDIPKGAPITPQMLLTRRPAWGIKPRYLAALTGLTAQRDIRAGEPVTWEMLSSPPNPQS